MTEQAGASDVWQRLTIAVEHLMEHIMRWRVHALESACQSGVDIEQQLKQAQQEMADDLKKLPHGHTSGFVVLCLWFAITLTLLVLAYTQLEFLLVELWQSSRLFSYLS